MRWRVTLATLLALGVATGARALNPEEQLRDPRLEARARAISRELRCVVCQSQTIDDSAAPVAEALRRLVRARLQAGDDDGQVIAAVTARYGDFVLLKPRVSTENALLWIGPFLVLGAAAAGGYRYVRSHADHALDAAPLTASDRLELAAAAAEHDPSDKDGAGGGR